MEQTKKNDGGLVFPSMVPLDQRCEFHMGLTARDYFAIQIASGMVCQKSALVEDSETDPIAASILAKHCYFLADTMLSARETEPADQQRRPAVPQPQVPNYWKLVPVEWSAKQGKAVAALFGRGFLDNRMITEIYSAFLSNAPAAPALEQTDSDKERTEELLCALGILRAGWESGDIEAAVAQCIEHLNGCLGETDE